MLRRSALQLVERFGFVVLGEQSFDMRQRAG
jgi:hypothetical protein